MNKEVNGGDVPTEARGEGEEGHEKAPTKKKKQSEDKRERQWKEDQREEERERGFCKTKIDQVK